MDNMEPLLSPVATVGNNDDDPEAQISEEAGASMSSPPTSPGTGNGGILDSRNGKLKGKNQRRSLVARMTTSCLIPAANGEYEGTAEQVDRIFEEHILPEAQTKNGFVDAVRFFDGETGDYVLISFWESAEDAWESANSQYYPAAQQRLWPHVRFNMFKTEHFRVLSVYPGAGGPPAVSSFACLNSITLRPQDSVPTLIPEIDEAFRSGLVHEASQQSGFIGAQRFVRLPSKDHPDAPKTCILATYWATAGSLQASTAAPRFEQSLAKIARFSRVGKVEATRLYRGEYFQLPRVPVCSRVFTEGSLRAATFQLACVCLGVGIFAMPGIFASAGLVTGTAMVVGFGVAADFAIQCLLWGAEAASAETAEDVLGAACGEFGRKLALLALALVCFMGNSAHVQFIAAQFMLLQGEGGGFVATIFGGDPRVQQAITGFLFGLLALPFCFKRSLAELRYVSLAVVFFALFTTVVVVTTCIVDMAGPNGTMYNVAATKPGAVVDYANYLGVAAFGFSMIIEVFAVRAEARERHRLGQAVHVAIAAVVVIMCSVGIVGALAIEDPGGNVLTNFAGNRFIAAISFGLVIIITLLYPLINFPMVVALDAITSSKGSAPNYSKRRLISVIGLACIVGMDALVPNVDEVFSLAGSLGLGLMAFTLPPAAFLFNKTARKGRPCVSVAAAALLLLGVGLTFATTGVTIYGIATANRTASGNGGNS